MLFWSYTVHLKAHSQQKILKSVFSSCVEPISQILSCFSFSSPPFHKIKEKKKEKEKEKEEEEEKGRRRGGGEEEEEEEEGKEEEEEDKEGKEEGGGGGMLGFY